MKKSDIVRLFQVTDTHCFEDDATPLKWKEPPVFPNRSLEGVCKRLLIKLKENPGNHSALVMTGDLSEEGSAATYRRLGKMLKGFPLPVYAIPGNHDSPKLMGANLKPIRYVKHAAFGVWNLFFLDSHEPGQPTGFLSPLELTKLEKGLARVPRDQHSILFVHHHPIDVESRWMDVMGLKEGNQFWELVSRFSSVKAVFHGHIHQEFSGAFSFGSGRQVAIFGTPATCIQVKPRTAAIQFDHDRPAWREITLHPDGKVATQVSYLA